MYGILLFINLTKFSLDTPQGISLNNITCFTNCLILLSIESIATRARTTFQRNTNTKEESINMSNILARMNSSTPRNPYPQNRSNPRMLSTGFRTAGSGTPLNVAWIGTAQNNQATNSNTVTPGQHPPTRPLENSTAILTNNNDNSIQINDDNSVNTTTIMKKECFYYIFKAKVRDLF